MPAFSAWSRRHKAVIWRFNGAYGADGLPNHDEPENIRVRWDDNSKTVRGPNGEPIAIDATAVMGEVPIKHSLMWMATDQTPNSEDALDQWYALGSAGDQTGLMVVVADKSGTDTKSRQTRYVAGLQSWKDKP